MGKKQGKPRQPLIRYKVTIELPETMGLDLEKWAEEEVCSVGNLANQVMVLALRNRYRKKRQALVNEKTDREIKERKLKQEAVKEFDRHNYLVDDAQILTQCSKTEVQVEAINHELPEEPKGKSILHQKRDFFARGNLLNFSSREDVLSSVNTEVTAKRIG